MWETMTESLNITKKIVDSDYKEVNHWQIAIIYKRILFSNNFQNNFGSQHYFLIVLKKKKM